MQTKASTPGIAIIGMGCLYPGASDLRQLWENILARRQQFRRTPDQRLPLSDYQDPDPTVPDKTYGSRMAVIDGFEFDWASKRIPKTVIETADIAHWVALEVATKALEDAGYTRESVATEGTGVLLGNTMTGEFSRSTNVRLRWPYVRRALIAAAEAKGLPSQVVTSLAETMEEYYKSVFSPITEDTLSGNLSNTIAGRICNFFNFDGGGYTVDGACSSSLIAVATAANALTNGDLDLALAGGVDISLDTFELIGFAKTGALTAGDMTVYDRKASGFIPGEGCGFVVLKRLEDARADGNYVYAVLNGWGISSDGKGGLTAPSRQGQAKALRRAYERAPYSPCELDFIEGHGTGTPVGDRTELEAIALAMSSDEPSPRSCGVTSFKSLVGHTKAAAGIGAFIKAVMAVNRRVLPPVAGCKEPNAVFESSAQCLYPILQGQIRSPTETLRAGVSAMGFGGINCHVTLESGDAPAAHFKPSIEERSLLVSNQETEIFVLSAASVSALLQRTAAVMSIASGLSVCELTDLALHLTRELEPQMPVRATVIAGTPKELIERLSLLEKLVRETPPAKGEVVISQEKEVWVGNAVRQNQVGFLFPGQGSQQLNMARFLVERFSWARELVEQADGWLRSVGCQGVSEFIYRPVDRAINREQVEGWSRTLAQTEVAQPAICLASLLWMRYLNRLGVKPTAVGGHSLGELTAFHAAGAFDEEALLRLAAVRGQAMSASVNGNSQGAMASLGCSQQTAETLLKQVSGYAVLANINSPKQMVISGEQASIEQVIELATASGIQTRRLPVSNGFHSQLVSAAAKHLSQYELVPETLLETPFALFSSLDGRQPAQGLRLREHFANQVVAQVDFISLVKTLVQKSDLLVEVGPGKVLSGLVRDIVGSEQPKCFPVESKAGLDRDLNTMLAALFVHGCEIKWEALYEGRLVRPFVPASKRMFIENPLERPFQVSKTSVSPALGASETSLHSMLTEQTQVPWAVLSDYISRRAGFLTEIIRADLQTLPLLSTSPIGSNGTGKAPVFVSPTSTPEVPKPAATQGVIASQDKTDSIEDILVNLIAQQTGFTPQSITPETRLLDDLNLDSIKAGEVIATTASEFGVAAKIDPASLANAKIQEIAEAIRAVMADSSGTISEVAATHNVISRDKTGSIEDFLVNLIAQQTGFTPQSITPETRLLDDLNLDSIKAGEVIAASASEFGVAAKIDPASLANAKIQEIAEAIRAVMADSSGTISEVAAAPTQTTVNGSTVKSEPAGNRNGIVPGVIKEVKRKTLVRDFIVRAMVEELPSVPKEGYVQENWQTANVLILCEESNLNIAQALYDQLHDQGAKVEAVSFAEARLSALTESTDFTHFIAVLPRIPSSELSPEARLLDAIGRLNSLAAIPSAERKAGKRTTVAYVQFGGGYFGTQPQIADMQQCCAVSFAATIHLERPDLKVRVIDFSPEVNPALLAERVLTEVSTQDGYTAVGYDTQLLRRVPRPCLQEPALYHSRNIRWSSSDVIIVTGGAKGITAECAIAIAQDTGARLALVGRSPHPKEEGRGTTETARTLERFRSLGLTCEYYTCDVSDFDSVMTVIQRIRQELGEITGVVHGAALNWPRRAEQVSTASAFDEVSPKLKGVMNLYHALQGTPLKLFAALSSVIGVTGMQRNAWYAFSNEAMDLILRGFKAQHPQTAVVSVAYSVWDEVGMGARMGSVRSLEKMGIGAIPKDEGVRRFLRLTKNDPGDVQVVVVAAMYTKAALDMQGFDTWNPPPYALPAASRFLEQILVNESGVEVVARSHLSLERDLYLRDHVYKGSYLFPTVFGLEAMAQAVAYATGEHTLEALRIEDIRLERPIVVSKDKGVDIEIHAEVIERESEDSVRRVCASIRTEQTGFAIDHFSATFVLGIENNPPKEDIKLPEAPLDIQPQEDLYTWLLFQGPLFQRLQHIYSLESNKFVFGAQIRAESSAGKNGFSDEKAMPLLLGDPYFRDALLQSAQVVIPKDLCLPVRIDSIEIYQRHSGFSGMRVGVMTPQTRNESEYSSTVFAIDDDGYITERLNGYVTRLLEHREDNPTAEEIVAPSPRDETILRRKLNEQAEQFNLNAPKISLAHLPGLHLLPKEERHQRELPLLYKAASLALNSSDDVSVMVQFRWSESGKPVLESVEGLDLDVSLSHDNQVCVCVVGPGPQGCDIERVVQRTLLQWTGLLSNVHEPILKQLLDNTDTLARAGTRIWTAVEALRKAINGSEISLEISLCKADTVLFSGIVDNQRLQVLTFPLQLSRGPERMVACVVQK
ncbi:beta ketoacyl-acyl carrier protein synthase [Scytonema sp. HK-05]|uniref:type I polyketide synthase n=1 Tax=Scytonema sp. HK-05 TaxID=1137095 RepID=UPI00093777EB|nr:type I polyketide synthase [Scytonema sp. HK-05]OKH57531.1 type I polyketide synthase [Scytonema sp. HK-05]BAY46765.1 beta ketoacyl-acyl carrier protein synthase [Scytonema sp. HK-05]